MIYTKPSHHREASIKMRTGTKVKWTSTFSKSDWSSCSQDFGTTAWAVVPEPRTHGQRNHHPPGDVVASRYMTTIGCNCHLVIPALHSHTFIQNNGISKNVGIIMITIRKVNEVCEGLNFPVGVLWGSTQSWGALSRYLLLFVEQKIFKYKKNLHKCPHHYWYKTVVYEI